MRRTLVYTRVFWFLCFSWTPGHNFLHSKVVHTYFTTEDLCNSHQPSWIPTLIYRFANTWASPVAQLIKNHLQCRGPQFDSWTRKLLWRRDWWPTPVFSGFPGGSDSEESLCSVEDLGLTPGLGRSPGGGHGNPLLAWRIPMDRGAWCVTVHGIAESQMWLGTAQHLLRHIYFN